MHHHTSLFWYLKSVHFICRTSVCVMGNSRVEAKIGGGNLVVFCFLAHVLHFILMNMCKMQYEELFPPQPMSWEPSECCLPVSSWVSCILGRYRTGVWPHHFYDFQVTVAPWHDYASTPYFLSIMAEGEFLGLGSKKSQQVFHALN